MRKRSPLIRSVAPLLLAICSSQMPVARADAPPTAASGLVAPRLTNTVSPTYPESKKASGESARVSMTLVIDASGTVTDVTLTGSAGDAFDAAALEAARKLTFSPAQRDGKAVPSRIPFAFDFAFEPPAAIAAATLGGQVITDSGDPLPGVTVTVTAVGSAPLSTSTDERGTFRFDRLEPGKYGVSVEGADLELYTSHEELAAGSATEVTYRPRIAPANGNGAPQELEVVGRRPAREVTRHVLEQREIAKLPGTNGDALRSLESMPGVARAPGLAAQLVVRGAGPNDTAVFVDGTPIPIAYHFGGLTSVIPTEALSRIDFTPGNFGAEYGRAMGGIVDVGLRSPRKDRWGGLLQLDLLDGRLLAEGPLGDKTRLMLALRRSWVDAWLGPALKSGGAVGVSTSPVYYDSQVVLEHDVASHTTARVAFLTSDDRLALNFSSPEGSDPITGFGMRTRFWRLQARTDTRVSAEARWINTLAYGTDSNAFDVGASFYNVAMHPLTLRSDLRVKLSDAVTAIAGFDGAFIRYSASVKAPPEPVAGQNEGPFFARPANLLAGEGALYRPAAYAMLEVSPLPGVKLLPSVRADYTSELKEVTISPRLAARFDVHPAFPRTTLKGGVGVYHQPPQANESVAPFGSPNVKSNRALHTSVGFEQELSRQVEVSFEGFYKKLDRLVVQQDAATTSQAGVEYGNHGSGHVYGSEMLLRYKPDARFFGWIAYTLSRSERRDSDGDAYRSFDFDQTHILTVLGSVQLGRGWELGGRFRYVTGNPYTPAVAGVLDADAGAYAPVNAAAFSARSAAFHRLDVRIEKKWTFESWKLSAYLDLQNAYNRQNPEGRSYNFNYTRSDVIAGLPILPVIGLRGEL